VDIWGGLVAGCPPEEIARRLGMRFEAPPEEIEEAVHALVEQLRQEGLLEEAHGAPDGEASNLISGDGDAATPRIEFQAPVLHRYTDMADFMLVDPIHEVDESGWPNRKVAS
jgi:hypothetical protein